MPYSKDEKENSSKQIVPLGSPLNTLPSENVTISSRNSPNQRGWFRALPMYECAVGGVVLL